MLYIAVVDDDEVILRYISNLLLDGLKEEKEIMLYTSSVVFFSEINQRKWDVVFLDIDMPDLTGIELAETLKCINPNTTIIFVSNFEQMVFKTFSVGAFYFVRKITLESDLQSALESYQKRLAHARRVFYFKTIETNSAISLFDILYFESRGHTIIMHAVNQTQHKLKRERKIRMGTLEDQLKADCDF